MKIGDMKIVPTSRRFSHAEAMRVYQDALQKPARGTIVVDLRNAAEATTPGLAQLVLLRKALLSKGKDLCLANMHDRVASLYGVNRLEGILPLAS